MEQPPIVGNVNRLRPPQQQLERDVWWRNLTFTLGLICSTFVAGSLSSFDEQDYQTAKRQAELVGEHFDRPRSHYGPHAFWVGVALIGVSQLVAIRVAIRETHLEQADRPR